MKQIHIFIITVIFSIPLSAQNFVVKDVRVFDGETVQEKVHVVVENGFITTISKKKVKDKSLEVIDGKGKTLMPALSNTHVHAWANTAMKEAAKAGVLNIMDMHGVEQFQGMMRQFNDSTNYANFYAAGSAATAPEGHGTQFGFPVPTLTKPEEAKKFISDRIAAKADYIKIIVEPWKKTMPIRF